MKSRSRASARSAGKSTIKAGAQIIVDTLIEQGVDTMFGYTGGVVLPLFDRLYDAPINFIVPRHEQGGCHMADAYARASGKVGVVLATSGPGACNLVTGLATAMMDSIPLVALTGQVRTELIGNDAFQEADTTGITRPVTKYNCIVKDIKDLQRTIREAFHIASTGRPGPVLIDIPVDVAVNKYGMDNSGEMKLPGYRIKTRGHARQVSSAAKAINKSKLPVLYVGGGVITANASEELRQLAKRPRFPGKAARTIVELSTMVARDFAGDAASIWRGRQPRDVVETLKAIRGVGDGIANMIVRILTDEKECFEFGYDPGVQRLRQIDVKPDTHLVRVFHRTGLVSNRDASECVRAARLLHPEFPGELDWPAWEIGRKWCHEREPNCTGCPLGQICPRRGVSAAETGATP